MARGGSSRRWLDEHERDPWVQRARSEGYRGRAAYKLTELDEREQLLAPGMTVVDLGAAPGAWSQYAVQRVGEAGLVVALDCLAMDPIPGVRNLEGDFTEEATLEALLEVLGERPVDLVLSDMAPNMSGMKAVDQPRSMELVELAEDLAGRVLRPGGSLVTKAFQGEGFDPFMARLKASYRRVKTRKPEASRARSPEVYVLARDFRVV
ncbi:23S rRNA (uridine(2552)-2'-O)-methyltransferase RlmE [Thiohalospira sp.]|uniref:23S rRNA (uridine(2552)-2'-O)-methyltransferase RlmE n=1 Tax=Thiohalospira sp. TaxID=3080549 RepID=UPI00398153BC